MSRLNLNYLLTNKRHFNNNRSRSVRVVSYNKNDISLSTSLCLICCYNEGVQILRWVLKGARWTVKNILTYNIYTRVPAK